MIVHGKREGTIEVIVRELIQRTYIATQLLSKSEKENLAKIFKEIDTNGDGKLSLEEVMNGYEKFFGQNKEKEDIVKMFNSVDTDGSGFIDYTEFVVASINEK